MRSCTTRRTAGCCELSQLRWTIALPLAPSGGPLGALGLGVGRSGRRYGAAELAFAELLVGRAGLALANTQLVSRLTATQRRLDGIFSALAEAVTVQGAGGRIEYANPAAAALLGLPGVHAVLTAEPSELVGRFEIHHPDGRPVTQDELPGARVLRGELPEPLLTQSVYKATGELRWFLTKATPLRDETGQLMAVNVIEDVTEEREAALRQRFLADAGEAFASSLDYELTLQRVAQLAVPVLADWCAVELPDERGSLEQVALAHAEPARVEQARALRERYPPDPASPVGSAAVLRIGRAAADRAGARLAARGIGAGRRAPRADPGAQHPLRDERADGHGRARARGDDASSSPRAGASTTRTTSPSRRSSPRARRPRSRTPASTPSAPRSRARCRRACCPRSCRRSPGWRFAADYRPGQRGAEVGGDFYDVFEVQGGADGAARGRHRHGRRGRGADLAGAPHGEDRRRVRPAPGRRPQPRQPRAAPAAADRARDDGLRPARRRRDHARDRRPSAAAAEAWRRLARRSAYRACCSAPSTTTPRPPS